MVTPYHTIIRGMLITIFFFSFTIKGPLKYLVAKLHRCYPGAISLPVSQNFFARFFRRRPVANSSRSLTFSLCCNKHKKHFLLTFLLINGLLYGYNMCVVSLFFILECFACRKMSSTYGRRLHVDGEISPRRQHTISSVRLGIYIYLKDAETQTKISIKL